MTALTPELLERYPYTRYADAGSIQRGRKYFKEGRVWDIELVGENKALCTVSGDSNDYTVEISVDQKSGELYFDCDCPYAEEHFCKHMIASALELSEYLKEQSLYELDDDGDELIDLFDEEEAPSAARPSAPAMNWRNRLSSVLHSLPESSRAGANIQHYAAAVLLVKESYYFESTYSFRPYVVKAKGWAALQAIEPGDAQAVHDLLDANDGWLKYGAEINWQTNPLGCINLSPEALKLLQLLQQYMRYFGGGAPLVASYMPLLAKLQIPLYLTSRNKNTHDGRVHVLPDPVELEISFTREGGNLILQPGFVNAAFSPGMHKLDIVSRSPLWLMMDHKIFAPRDPGLVSSLHLFPIVVPESEADTFREHYLQRVAETLPIRSDLLNWIDVQVDPTPRLYLRDDKDNKLRGELRFGYGEYELLAAKSAALLSTHTLPGSWDILRIHRQPEREQEIYQLLTDPVYRLKRSGSDHPFGTFELRARAHPVDFLMHSVPLLAQVGFEIYGEEKLKAGKINRSTPTVRVNITSGIDWFDLKAFVEYGDQQVSLQDVRKALKRGEHYIKLADGSMGQIPDEWLEKYKHLWDLADETAEGFRVRDYHIPLIDALLEGGAAVQPPPDLAQRKRRLRSFEQIESQPLPQRFTGELRPYQQHGFDWLHFLREYKFGGILADDMGLGKTVQMLAYLQSLREQAQTAAPSLLVVPKSLIANWQREAARFTPELRFLDYTGAARDKNTASFKNFDVVLTTYGTMLHDIDSLRKYKFHYVILDESQAIKNPLAKSAKAARLLKADHRLVMTGTPVENNTFELWSQFAFLNPGLLGNMDYFKREFAKPIESGQDERSAETLRKLVYPFILRRTKEQVAPELPPRTERVIYTDMDAAQKKLYARTRERYRAELLGLIESEGIQDARFRILEGLLRLRQIAIHPGLVEHGYKGGAPKFELLMETLETLHAERHKALIFSQFVETLKLVRHELDKQKIKYAYLDGSTPDRQKRVDAFQNDPAIPFFLISLKAGGVGLNLTAADYVIHLDPWWNPAVEMQASDRAHRIGQDKPVFIYKIITRDTVEEKILQLQEKKRQLVKSIIATEASFFKSLTADDVKSLFA